MAPLAPPGVAGPVYLSATLKDGSIKSSLVTSKSRVSPMERQTLPRTELLGNLLLARLMNSVKTAFENTIEISKVYFWTDSQICLSWIKSNKSFKTFIQNRVAEIRKLSDLNNWYYCQSKLNPADVITRRSLTPCELINSDFWWHGSSIIIEQHTTDLKNNDHLNFETNGEFLNELKALIACDQDCEKNKDIKLSELIHIFRILVI